MKKTYQLNGFSEIYINDIVVCRNHRYRVVSKCKLLQKLSKRFGLESKHLINLVNRFTKHDVIGFIIDDIVIGTSVWNNSDDFDIIVNNEKIIDIVSPEGVSKKINQPT